MLHIPNVVDDILTDAFKVVRCVVVITVTDSVDGFIDKVDDDVDNEEVFGIWVELGSFFISLILEATDVLISLDVALVSEVCWVLSVVDVSSLDDGTTLLICASILSAFASMISKPARMKSKKLLSVVEGSALNGGKVVVVDIDDDGTDVVETSCTITSFSFGSSDPNSNEKKSIVSPSSSTSSSSSSSFSCRECRLTFNERLRQS